MSTGFVIFAHGSSIESANESVRESTRQFIRQTGFELVETGFLELGRPDLPEAVARIVERGARRVIVVPYFLTAGRHLQVDLPRILDEIGRVHPGVQISATAPLDGHPALATALAARAREAL